ENGEDDAGGRTSKDKVHERGEVEGLTQLRRSLLLAALACVLRPTNLLIWLCVAVSSFVRATNKERTVLVREAAFCGSCILALSILSDRFYYQTWTFPPLRFLHFNIAQSLAVFYGKNNWHYYLSQGYPLLLTTFLPFALIGLYRALVSSISPSQSYPRHNAKELKAMRIGHELATTALIVPAVLSLISHKEVRFIYPLLPILHILAAQPFTSFFLPAVSPASAVHTTTVSRLKKSLLALILALNVFIGLYTTTVHQSGVLSVLDYLRHEHEHHYLTQPPAFTHITAADTTMTVGFLMPCHSTPWRSHLVHSGITAWALGCEPPIDMNATERATYIDEADRFYANPTGFMRQEMGPPPRLRSSLGFRLPRQGLGRGIEIEDDGTDGKVGNKQWPEYLIFFQQAEETMRLVLRGSGYRECWRGFNSHWHDDWRRKGDVIVWCLTTRSGSRAGNA
ncbi:MAG: glycosylphosphatidylinositol anchor biosynthesis, partial [Pleopsidium flavum]